MPKSKKVKNEAKEVHQAVQGLIKRTKNKPRGRLERSRERVLEHQSVCQHNSDCWIMSLISPFSCKPQRFPTAISAGTDVTQLNWITPLPVFQGSSANFAGAQVMRPCLKNFMYRISSLVDANSVTWSPVDHPKMSSLQGLASAYRVTALGARIQNCGALMERGMRIFVGLVPPVSANQAPASTLLSSLATATTTQLVSSTHLSDNGDLELSWIPFTTQAWAETTTDGTATSSAMTGLGFRYPDYANTLDNGIVIFAYSERTGASPPSDDFVVETVLNIEFIPQVVDQYLFSGKVALGGDSNVAASIATVAKNKPLGKILEDGVLSKVGNSFNHFMKNMNSTAQMVTEGLGVAAGFAGMLAARPLPPRRDPPVERKERDLRPPPLSRQDDRYIHVDEPSTPSSLRSVHEAPPVGGFRMLGGH
jgi:hypothetical protein